jgi:hypothetical protein
MHIYLEGFTNPYPFPCPNYTAVIFTVENKNLKAFKIEKNGCD